MEERGEREIWGKRRKVERKIRSLRSNLPKQRSTPLGSSFSNLLPMDQDDDCCWSNFNACQRKKKKRKKKGTGSLSRAGLPFPFFLFSFFLFPPLSLYGAAFYRFHLPKICHHAGDVCHWQDTMDHGIFVMCIVCRTHLRDGRSDWFCG